MVLRMLLRDGQGIAQNLPIKAQFDPNAAAMVQHDLDGTRSRDRLRDQAHSQEVAAGFPRPAESSRFLQAKNYPSDTPCERQTALMAEALRRGTRISRCQNRPHSSRRFAVLSMACLLTGGRHEPDDHSLQGMQDGVHEQLRPTGLIQTRFRSHLNGGAA
jgi:hypothetical protein